MGWINVSRQLGVLLSKADLPLPSNLSVPPTPLAAELRSQDDGVPSHTFRVALAAFYRRLSNERLVYDGRRAHLCSGLAVRESVAV